MADESLTPEQKREALAVIDAAALAAKGNKSQAAREVGLSQQSFLKALSDRQIGIANLRKMATKLGRSIGGVGPTAASSSLRRWEQLAAVSDAFREEAADATAAGFTEAMLDAAAVRLAGKLPTREQAEEALRQARRGVSKYAESEGAPGLTPSTLRQETSVPKSGKSGKRSST